MNSKRRIGIKPQFVICLSVLLVICVVILIYITFSNAKNDKLLSQLSYGNDKITTIALNNLIYEVTSIEVSIDKINVQIGSILRQVSPRPERNGDIAINISEPQNLIKWYNVIYQISDLDQRDGVAIQLDAEHYYLCKFYCEAPYLK